MSFFNPGGQRSRNSGPSSSQSLLDAAKKCSGQMCIKNPENGFKVSFTYDEADFPEDIYNIYINDVYNTIRANPLNLATTPISALSDDSSWGNVQIQTPSTLVGTPYSSLSTLDDAKWLFIAKLFALSFGFSPNRIVNCIIEPVRSNNMITSLNVEFTIANFVQNKTNSIVIPGPDPSLPNDKQSAVCLGLWVVDNLLKGVDLEFISGTVIPREILDKNICKKNNETVVTTNNKPNNRRVVVTPSGVNAGDRSILNFSNVRGGIIHKNNTVEYFQVNTSQSGPTNVSPRTITDYLFMFSYLISFVGAIFFAMASLVQIDPSTLIANKNVSFALNIFIGISGLVSMLIWLNYDIDFEALYLVGLNHAVVKQTI